MVIGPFSSVSCSTLHGQQSQFGMNHLCIVSVLLFEQCTNCPLVSNSLLPWLFIRTNIRKQLLPGLKFCFFLYLLPCPRLFIAYQLVLHTYLIFVGFLPRLHDNGTTLSGGQPSLAVISSLGHWNRFFSSWCVRNQSLSLALPVPRAFGGIANKSCEGCSFQGIHYGSIRREGF